MSRKRNRTPKTLVDIVIPVYGRFDLLTQCLAAIPDAFQEVPYNIILVDNNSPDKGQFYSDLPHTIIQNQNNYGFIRASNDGASKGRSPLIFFLNSDVILEPGSGEELIKTLDTPTVGIVGMKLLFPAVDQLEQSGLNPYIRPAKTVQHVGLATNIRREINHTFIGWSAEAHKVNAVSEVFAVTGAALMIRRPLFQQAGGFDRDFGLGTYEDVALCMAIRKMGYNIQVNPKAVGTHFVGASSEKYQKYFPLNKNYHTFLVKWEPYLKQWDYNIL